MKKFKTKLFKVPHVFVLLFIIVLMAAALTYIIPAGEFDRVEDPNTGNTIVEEGTYQNVEQQPIHIVEIPRLFITGLNEASDIILFIFVVGGAFQIITATKVFDSVVRKVTKMLGNKEILIIPLLLVLFSIGGFTIGMTVEGMALVPLAIALSRSLGYDAITGLSMVLIGVYSGFISGMMNPFNVGVAQEIAEIPIYSGMWLRAIVWVVLLIVSSLYIIRYASKVKKDPSKSIVFEMEQSEKISDDQLLETSHFQVRHYFVLMTIIVGLGVLVWGVGNKGWYINDIAALFLAIGVIAGICAGLNPSRIAEEFIRGAKAFTLGALIVGVARAIPVALEEGLIIDSVINGLANLVILLPDSIQVLGLFFTQTIINFFINSGSGQAAATMPIIAPLGDLIGITRQTGVLTFQLGDGFTNLIYPTGSTLMAYLAASGVPYEKWVKFIWPLILIFIAIGGIFVVVANVIQY
ncbi:YfcC family protein [Virgibacillus sp. NKC19-3]|uniref:YfcC family protein n=1 Tax=Virgibacillus saliphilus TaxID=2831674 RepID=UPI001C9A9E35|nr:TIGR00366 family protein [Virgibacillus sp. NKC19-3]MBY7144433.1 YfcC family protein [Virgibacillus sp. NKC19-3]